MNLQVAKWGNSLAVRIPVEYVRSIGIKEGDSVQASLTSDGGISIHPLKWDRKAFAQAVAAFSASGFPAPAHWPVVIRWKRYFG